MNTALGLTLLIMGAAAAFGFFSAALIMGAASLCFDRFQKPLEALSALFSISGVIGILSSLAGLAINMILLVAWILGIEM